MKKAQDSLYFNIYKKIIFDIQNKKLTENEKLPSVRKAATFYNVSCNTIQNAYNQLLDEGYIYSKEKKGYFVSKFDSPIVVKKEGKNQNSSSQSQKKINKNEISLEANITDTSFFPYATLRQLYREVLSQKNNEILERLGDFQGEEKLREAICNYVYTRRGVNCTANQIIIGGGTSDLIQLLIRLFALKDNHTFPVFFLETPGFTTIEKIILDSKCNIVHINICDDGADINSITENSNKVENKTCLLHLTPSHQFPTGVTMTAPRRSSILQWANEKQNRYIIEDDYDSDFRYKGIPITSMQGYDENQKVIYMGTFSRTLTPALRVSYIVLPQELVSFYQQNFTYYKCPVPRIEQQVLANFILGGFFERHINRAKKIYKSRRDLMLELLYKHFPDIQIKGEQAGLHFIAKFSEKSESEIIELAKKNNVTIYGTGTGWLIIGYAHLNFEEIYALFENFFSKILK